MIRKKSLKRHCRRKAIRDRLEKNEKTRKKANGFKAKTGKTNAYYHVGTLTLFWIAICCESSYY